MSDFTHRNDCLNCKRYGCWILILAPLAVILAWMWSWTKRPAHIGPGIKAPWQDRLLLYIRERLGGYPW
jgi:hypothetical protein